MPVADEQLVDLVLSAKDPRVQICGGGKPKLLIGPDECEITMEQADLLFQTMFFRGKV